MIDVKIVENGEAGRVLPTEHPKGLPNSDEKTEKPAKTCYGHTMLFLERVWDLMLVVFRLDKDFSFDEQIKRLCVIGSMLLLASVTFFEQILVVWVVIRTDDVTQFYSPNMIALVSYQALTTVVFVLYFSTKRIVLTMFLWNLCNVGLCLFFVFKGTTAMYEPQPMVILPFLPSCFILFKRNGLFVAFLVLVLASFLSAYIRDLITVDAAVLVDKFEGKDLGDMRKHFTTMYMLNIFMMVANTTFVLYLIINLSKTNRVIDQLEKALKTYVFKDVPFYQKIAKKKVKFLTRFEIVVKDLMDRLIQFSSYVPQTVKRHVQKELESSNDSESTSCGSKLSLGRINSSLNSDLSRGGQLRGLQKRDVVFLLVFFNDNTDEVAIDVRNVYEQFFSHLSDTAERNKGNLLDVWTNKALITFNDTQSGPYAAFNAVNCIATMGKKYGGIIIRSKVLCGLIESKSFSKFFHFGTAVERLFHLFNSHSHHVNNVGENGLPIVVDGFIGNEIKFSFKIKQVDRVEWKENEIKETQDENKFECTEKNLKYDLFKIVGVRKGCENEEWMYSLARGLIEKQSPPTIGSVADDDEWLLEMLLKGWKCFKYNDFEKAMEIVKVLEEIKPCDNDVECLKEKINKKIQTFQKSRLHQNIEDVRSEQ